MGEKVYKPIVKDGDHLDRSRANPDRVRGVSRDQDNKNPDIIEWEEYDIDDLQYPSANERVELTPEQQELVEVLSNVLTGLAIYVVESKVAPFCKETIWPWMKRKGRQFKEKLFCKKTKGKTQKSVVTPKAETINYEIIENTELSDEIDRVFNQTFDLNEEEAKQHFMRLLYHMLGVMNEIRILSNARIMKECTSEELCLERQREAEKLLSQRVASSLNQLLEEKKLQLDLNTSKELFALTGGGVWMNGEYAPVQAFKIEEAFKRISLQQKGMV